jgi:hypothetical protein
MSSIIEEKARILAESAKIGVYNDKQIIDLVKAVEDADEDKNGRKARFRIAAKTTVESEGDLEFDSDSIVSISSDGGAYVQCWKYIELK